jgi:acyl dehydratase
MTGPVAYFEDVVVGESVTTPAMTVTQMHAALFAGLAGEPVDEPGMASDLLPLCLSIGLGWRTGRPALAVLAFMGFEWQFVHRVRVGDTIHATSRATSRRMLRDGGVVVEDHQIIDHRGQVVQKGRFTFLVARRPVEGAGKETKA